ncbi:hypothetical protein LINGRAHAP2_LOCUS20255 [Linum grandiflorum]
MSDQWVVNQFHLSTFMKQIRMLKLLLLLRWLDRKDETNKGAETSVKYGRTGKEDLQGQTDALMSQSSIHQARNKDKTLFERELIEHKKKKLSVTKEQLE